MIQHTGYCWGCGEVAEMQHVFIIGAKGVSFYGGYESFVQKLLEYHKDNHAIQYHVSCKANGEGSMNVAELTGASEVKNGRFCYCGADCFLIRVPKWLGSAQAIAYDVASFKECCRYIEENKINNAIVYILACRIGPFVSRYVKRLHRLGGRVYLNPDGHEWKRAKWSAPVRRYWKESERLMVKNVDLVICDSINIEKYIQKEYASYHPQTTYIAYGAEVTPSKLEDNDIQYKNWLDKHGLRDHLFFTMVSRCVPENNYETIIREFMKSKIDKDLAIICTENFKMLQDMENKLHYSQDNRIKFVGTVYDQELLKKIRENCFGYFHGHSVGGTNPSLLEALGSTKVNLLYDIGFNREVAEDAAVYWSLDDGCLAELIERIDKLSEDEIRQMSHKAKKVIADKYSWEFICDCYAQKFLECKS